MKHPSIFKQVQGRLNESIRPPLNEVQTSIVSDDEEISSQARALMINTCESSHYLGQLWTAGAKQSITAV